MDGIANVARQQQSQVSPQEAQGRVDSSQQTQQTSQSRFKQQENVVKEIQNSSASQGKRLESEKDVQELVKDLNDALAPLNTSLKFGVDQHDVFYVSVIEEKTHKMIRRFPAEQAQDFLPKMQEVTGILFDSKG
ncbi:flagellar protein FlaG [Sulfurimonas sp.]